MKIVTISFKSPSLTIRACLHSSQNCKKSMIRLSTTWPKVKPLWRIKKKSSRKWRATSKLNPKPKQMWRKNLSKWKWTMRIWTRIMRGLDSIYMALWCANSQALMDLRAWFLKTCISWKIRQAIEQCTDIHWKMTTIGRVLGTERITTQAKTRVFCRLQHQQQLWATLT